VSGRGEQGLGLVELVISLGISALILSTLGMVMIATLRNTSSGRDQQQATQQIRNGLFWLNQDTQSGVAGLATVAAGDVTLQWTDYSTDSEYTSRYQQSGSTLVRTLTVDGLSSSRTIATNVVASGFSASMTGNAVTYTITVANGASSESRSETAMMRVGSLPPTAFPTVTASPTYTNTPSPTPTNTPTNTPTATLTITPTPTSTPTSTPTNTPTPTSTPTSTSTSTPTAITTATWLQTGTYTGNGTAGRTITASFQPDAVIIKSDSGDDAVIRTSVMPASVAKDIAGSGALAANLITSFGATSFVVGSDTSVNGSGKTYYWTAMKTGTNLNVGMYTGDGSDNRNISGLSFQPDWVITMGDAQADYFKPAPLAGDAAFAMNGTGSVTNRIQALQATGFQIGSDASVNENARAYYWIAFDATSQVAVDSYTGDNSDNRNVTGLGLDPAFVWVKRSSLRPGVWRNDAVPGDRTLYWDATLPEADLIQALIADGFQVGGNHEVNNNTKTYYYLALAP
jgi:hypothetical protein